MKTVSAAIGRTVPFAAVDRAFFWKWQKKALDYCKCLVNMTLSMLKGAGFVLLCFRVGNHHSFREPQKLLLTASSLKDRDEGLIQCRAAPTGLVVPAGLVYGANASGKTNLLDALITMRDMVLSSHAAGLLGDGIQRHPFLLEPGYEDNVSLFDIDFVIDDVHYNYGFEASDARFESEWLYSTPKAHRQMLFKREGDRFKFGRNLRGPVKIIANRTRSNSLFLSVGAQNDYVHFEKIFNFFNSIHLIRHNASEIDFDAKILQNPSMINRIVSFLNQSDSEIIDFRKKKLKNHDRKKTNLLLNTINLNGNFCADNDIKNFSRNPSKVDFEFGHRVSDGHTLYFDISLESAGTRRLLSMLGSVYQALDAGTIVCIDELDASIHILVAEAVLNLFCYPDTNPNGAQLIATTHDTKFFRSKIIRRDQFWFVEKNEHGATELYPLTDFRTKKNDDFENNYLRGRYGSLIRVDSI